MLTKMKKEFKTSNLKNLVVWDEVPQADLDAAKEVGFNVYSFAEVIEAGKKSSESFKEPTNDSVFMLSYTSGTTGNPKAVKLTHKMILSVIGSASKSGVVITMKDTFISYLPLAHSMEQCFIGYTEIMGGRYGFYSGDPLKLADDCQALKPTIFVSVPRMFNKVYDRVMAGLKEKTPKQQKMFMDALDKKKRKLRSQAVYKDGLWDKLIFSKI